MLDLFAADCCKRHVRWPVFHFHAPFVFIRSGPLAKLPAGGDREVPLLFRVKFDIAFRRFAHRRFALTVDNLHNVFPYDVEIPDDVFGVVFESVASGYCCNCCHRLSFVVLVSF